MDHSEVSQGALKIEQSDAVFVKDSEYHLGFEKGCKKDAFS